MQLHVLAGCHDLLRPAQLEAAQAASLIGERVRAATAFWLSSRHGQFYHDFLRENPHDRRVKVFATSLVENFGSRFEPLVVLPELLAETANGAAAPGNGRRSALDIVDEIHRECRPRIQVHVLALPDPADPDGCWTARGATRSDVLGQLDALREACRARGFPEGSPSCAVIEVVPGLPQAALMIRNAAAPAIAERIVARLAGEEGLMPDASVVERAVHEVLARWSEGGLAPALSADARQLDGLADKILRTLLARCAASKKSGFSGRTERFGRRLHEMRIFGSAE